MPLNRIKELRKERGLTQAGLAAVFKVSPRTIGFYETSQRNPDTETLKKLADFFEVSIDYLLGHGNLRNPYKLEEKQVPQVFDSKHLYDEDLPEEAKEEIEKFAEYIRYKYGKKEKK
jgi:transcriptional regulator with XRE-family HTH domain